MIPFEIVPPWMTISPHIELQMSHIEDKHNRNKCYLEGIGQRCNSLSPVIWMILDIITCCILHSKAWDSLVEWPCIWWYTQKERFVWLCLRFLFYFGRGGVSRLALRSVNKKLSYLDENLGVGNNPSSL